MKRMFLKSMAAGTVLLLASCSNQLALEDNPDDMASGDEVIVTFSVTAENVLPVSRAEDAGPGRWQDYAGRGKEIDVLIYAVYEQNTAADGSISYNLLKQYGDGIVPDGLSSSAAFTGAGATHDGQAIVADPFGQNSGNGNAYQIALRLLRGKVYTIAFWAQSSKTDAYDTSNLENVKVNYSKNADGLYLNNDEYRDAFCKAESFSVIASETRDIKLTRPFAQINVGATGAYLSDQNLADTEKSKIELNGVSDAINVVANQVLDSNEHLTSVTFDYNTLIKNGASEEYLKVDLNNDGVITGNYDDGASYPTIDPQTNMPKTEQFKYLSMCYVLVPARIASDNDAAQQIDDNLVDQYYSTTLSSLSVYFANADGANTAAHISNLQNVPVHRNWRTNLIMGLSSKIDGLRNITVSIAPAYDGEYNNGGTWTEDDYK